MDFMNIDPIPEGAVLPKSEGANKPDYQHPAIEVEAGGVK
jgi:hypothetical protein